MINLSKRLVLHALFFFVWAREIYNALYEKDYYIFKGEVIMMKNSTKIMCLLAGGIIGLTLRNVMGILPVMGIAFVIGCGITILNERYNRWF